ncbi:beta-N-acetylhexosaminidase [Paenibacillus abyssi]|uniref:beta-N-acetylhexosaminidase n=1 Tax=Paenibacillus abyssi TaxID=1340531 RepID=A0A917FMT5_9BACL|nr:beta-N-acetylhexosaminidase [Paenibacillus abyssi]GGF94499.1 hypothetical protein GCM10010916_09810 [Paenibacillus abyssi]
MRLIKRAAVMMALMLVTALLHPSDSASAQPKFTDLQYSQWAADSIHYLADRGTVAGYGQGRFGPLDTITRAQAVVYLVRELFPDEKANEAVSFKDVPGNHFFYKEISIAFHKGIIGGFPGEVFRPDEWISRAETAAILTRSYRVTQGNRSVQLTDIDSNWAAGSIRLLASNGLVGGYSDQTFRPGQSVTRAEFAVFLTRMIRYERAKAIEAQDWDRLLALMSVKEKVGQMFMPDIRMWNRRATTTMNDGIESTIKNNYLGGLILFDKNIVNVEQLTTFTHQLQQKAGDIPMFLGIDQEGGAVKRIPDGTNLPGNMALGAARKPALSYEAGKITGTELKALGVNLNFAPVLDININPRNPVIGIRSFGADPHLVTDLGVQFMKGQNHTGVISTVKHFPGHGDTHVDSHLGLPSLPHDKQRLDEVELVPFRAAIREGADMIMTAHVTFPEIDNTQMVSKLDGSIVNVPATLSRKVLTGLLRDELGFDGVIISDAFTMKAISEHFGEAEAVKMAVSAGADIILMPRDVDAAFQSLAAAVEQGEISEQAIDRAVKRILLLKQKYKLFDRQPNLQSKIQAAKRIIGDSEHQAVEAEIAKQAVTLQKNDRNYLPYAIREGQSIVIVAPTAGQAEQLSGQLKAIEAAKQVTIQLVVLNELNGQAGLRAIEQADFVIAASYQYRSPLEEYAWSQWQSLIDHLNAQSKPYAFLSMGNPYELMFLRNVQTALAVYGEQTPNRIAGLNVIFGHESAGGTLPVLLTQ